MISVHPQPRRALRNWAIASIIAFAVSLAPIVRTDTIKLVHTVFAGSSHHPAALVRADVTK